MTEVEIEPLLSLVEKVLEGEGEDKDVSLALVPRDEIQGLNKFFRRKDEPTDVLSFDLSRVLQVVVCPEETDEIERAVVHGLLHLLGYDHETEAGFKKMRSRENKYL